MQALLKAMFGSKKSASITILSLLVLAVVIISIFSLSADNNSTTSSKLSIGNSPVLGNASAELIIYEFSDFSCPFCAAAEGKNQDVINMLKSRNPEWEAPLPKIKEEYVNTGKAKLVFKYFPGHGEAQAAHAVALGLNEQNPELFWKFAEKAFSEQSGLNNLGKMMSWAISLGANETQLNNYLASKKYEVQLSADIKMGQDNNIKGTPTFIINNQIIEGAQSFDVFKKVIDEELSR